MSVAPGALRVLFVCVSDFSSPGEKQVLGFAQELLRRGHAVMISINGDPATAAAEGADAMPGLVVRAHRFAGRGLSAADKAAAVEFAPTIIHAFNARVPVAGAAAAYAEATGAPVAVHFEDDEWGHSQRMPDVSRLRLLAQAGRRLVSRVRPSAWYYSTPRSLAWAARQAGFDALTPALAAQVESKLGRPCSVVLPVTPTMPADVTQESAAEAAAVPAGLQRGAMCVITGALFPPTQGDVVLALDAIADVQRRGVPATFVHAGQVLERMDADALAAASGLEPGSWAFLGYRPFRTIDALLRSADVLLSPGHPNEQNRLRLPSKLQTYLASGTPTITFSVGFGDLVEDRVEVMKTYTGESSELAAVLHELLTTPELRDTLSHGGPAAAARLFDTSTNVDALEAHYRRVLASAPGPG